MKGIEELIEKMDRPPLLIGKGPSFALIKEMSLESWTTIALNHAIRKTKANLCSIIDIDVVKDLGETLYENAENVCLPSFPHINFQYSEKSLFRFLAEYPVLMKLENEGRLYTYHLNNCGWWRNDPKIKNLCRVYKIGVNNGDTFLEVLAANGLKNVYSIGVDGGKSYDPNFFDLKPLTNGRETFSDQDVNFEAIEREHGCKLIRIPWAAGRNWDLEELVD
jgi:hypothetical protein